MSRYHVLADIKNRTKYMSEKPIRGTLVGISLVYVRPPAKNVGEPSRSGRLREPSSARHHARNNSGTPKVMCGGACTTWRSGGWLLRKLPEPGVTTGLCRKYQPLPAQHPNSLAFLAEGEQVSYSSLHVGHLGAGGSIRAVNVLRGTFRGL